VQRKNAFIGFCFDAYWHFSVRPGLSDAAISFHGSQVGKHLDEAANMSKGEGPSGYCPLWPRARI